MSDTRRQIAAHAAAGLGLCFGGYALLVSPAAKDLAAARAESLKLTDEVRRAEALGDRSAAMTDELGRLTDEAARIDQDGSLARNERDLFAAISGLAQRSHVRIDQLAPSKMAAGKGGTKARSGDAAVRYSMTAVGGYGDVAAFLRSVREELGFASVRSVRLSPLPDDAASAVKATIETEHFAFDVAPAADAPGGETGVSK